jgi:ATP-dependent Clp protease adaptor protein ClpS
MTRTKKSESSGVQIKERIKLKKPSLYKVILLNDDVTTMEFVVRILQEIFKKEISEAMRIMLDIHKKGSGICGVFTKEIAEAKCQAVRLAAELESFPLKSLMEPE